MRTNAKMTPQQIAKAVKLWQDGDTYEDIAALLHISRHQIGDAVAQWTKDNAERLKNNLRQFIHANIASGNSSMHLPRTSPIVSRPVLAEFAKWYTITTKIKLSCMWHQFTPKAKPCK